MNRHNAKGAPKPEGFYIGLTDKSGEKDMSFMVLDNLPHQDYTKCEGIYTNEDGKTYKEPSIYIENISLANVEYILRVSQQESALMFDSWGEYWLIYPDKPSIKLGTGFFTTEQRSPNTTKIGNMYLNIRGA